ncbi:MAG: hypothetical protein CMO10_06185 [Thalassospira sp.]|nr:hypothetical protein [Thalassospira sp.]
MLDTVPPAIEIKDGKLSGFGMTSIEHLINRLPNYSIRLEVKPRGRAFASMRRAGVTQNQTICIPGLLETDHRTQEFVFSDTILSMLPISVIVSAKRASDFSPFIDDAGEVSLTELLKEQAFSPAIEAGRSYGRQIDKAIRTNGFGAHIQKTRQHADFAKMLELGRIDWFLAYPIEAGYLFGNNVHDHDFTSLPIAEVPDILHAKVACSDTKAGRDIIGKINTIVADISPIELAESYMTHLTTTDAEYFRTLIGETQ